MRDKALNGEYSSPELEVIEAVTPPESKTTYTYTPFSYRKGRNYHHGLGGC